jgi:Fe-S cluster assembly protein SufD
MAATTTPSQASAVNPANKTVQMLGRFGPDGFAEFLKRRQEPAWLTAARHEAHARLLSLPWPSPRDEEWRRTDIRGLNLGGFDPARGVEADASAATQLDKASVLLRGHAGRVIEHINGVRHETTGTGVLPSGVIFMDLGTAVREHPALVEHHLMKRAVPAGTDVFSALHGAYWSNGTLLYVPRGVKIKFPLGIVAALVGGGQLETHHTLVVLEEGAEATLVQETASAGRAEGSAGLHVGSIELLLGPRAKLRFVSIQNWDLATWHFSRDRAILDRDAALQWTIGGLGSRLTKVNQEVVLAGEGSQAQVNGVLFTTGRQNLTYLTRQEHAAPHTTSDLLYKGGLKDSSRLVWKGMIRVEPGAQKTDAYQKNENLILAETSRADSIPGLEIEANDVRCTHGATAGQVDQDMVFYLQSRGMRREEAVRLIVEGFFANVYDRITLEPVREALHEAVAQKLSQ